MYKEIIIIMVVISLIVGLDIITNNYTKQSLEIMTSELNILRKYILNEDKTKAQEQMKIVKERLNLAITQLCETSWIFAKDPARTLCQGQQG